MIVFIFMLHPSYFILSNHLMSTTPVTLAPLRVINSIAPTRVCDNGGWTDTWFAQHGQIFNIAVTPGVEVQIAVYPRAAQAERVIVQAENYGQTFTVDPGSGVWPQHRLIAAAFDLLHVPEDLALIVTVYSGMPPGASVGTSAALAVALIAGLDCLTPGRKTAHELAYAAHALETQLLKQQSGIQDQLAAAYGGLSYIDMINYPHAMVSPIKIAEPTWHELNRRLALVYLGRPHLSSAIHESVIRELEGAGPNDPRIAALRKTAAKSRDAVLAGDFAALGQAMIENNDAQANLRAALISPEARQVIEIAKAHGALGWKVNGAGGEGGSITLLCDHAIRSQRTMLNEIEQTNTLFRSMPIRLCQHGATAWESG